MRTPKISYPKCVSTMLKSADMPERTITIKNKNGKDSIQSEFVGLHAKEKPLWSLCIILYQTLET